MSEPDAVPLPREGEVFFDVRGDARTMRLSWYADSKIAVFSIWQANRCTGTFRLPFADLARMVHALQSGPPQAASFDVSESITQVGLSDSYEGAGVTGAYGGATHPGEHIYAPAGLGGGDVFGGSEHPYADHAEPAYLPSQPYDAPYGTGGGHGQPYAGPELYQQPQPYEEPQRYQEEQRYEESRHYEGTRRLDAAPQYGAGEPYGEGQSYGQQYSSGQSHGRHGSAAHSSEPYGPYGSDYEQPNYPEHAAYAGGERGYRPGRHGYDEDIQGTAQGAQPGDWTSAPATAGEPSRARDEESVPDAAMLSFPSVPARNGPAGYR